MKKTPLLLVLTSILFAGYIIGCGILPKNVEFFQKKVPTMPVKSATQVEKERQAADYVAAKTGEAKDEAIRTAASETVLVPIDEAHQVAGALSTSLGPPTNPWRDTAERLALQLKSDQAHYNGIIESYRHKIADLEGKKIEGTGFFQFGYFTWLAICAGAGFLLLTGVRIYGMVNPVVGAGYTALRAVGRVGTGVLSKGFAEVVEGGERFKDAITASGIPDELKNRILTLFHVTHTGSQSRDVQDLVASLTKSLPTVTIDDVPAKAA